MGKDIQQDLARFSRRRRCKTEIDNARWQRSSMPVNQFAIIPVECQNDKVFDMGSLQYVLIFAARRFLDDTDYMVVCFSQKPNAQKREILISQKFHYVASTERG